MDKVKIDKSNKCIERITKRCIDCGMCINVCENIVGINQKSKNVKESLCINCGECINNCLAGALLPKYCYKEILNLIKNTRKTIAISIDPIASTFLSEEFGLENIVPIIPTIMRKIGFDYVFDGGFGIDVNILKTAEEVFKNIDENKVKPLYMNLCPSFLKYVTSFHPEILEHILPIKPFCEVQSTLIKTYFKESMNLKKDIISVIATPCIAQKETNENTDFVITIQELAMMIRECDIKIDNLKPSNFDELLCSHSNDANTYGIAGKYTESVLNTLYYLMTNKEAPSNYFDVNLKDYYTISTYLIRDKIITVAIINGLKNLERFLNANEYADFIEVTNCKNGCISGGGMPLSDIGKMKQNREARINRLRETNIKPKHSHQNIEIKTLYK